MFAAIVEERKKRGGGKHKKQEENELSPTCYTVLGKFKVLLS